MEINKLKENNELILKNNIINEKTQNNFLETILGKTINTAVDIGIRALLPNFVEDQVINLKDNLLNYGLKEGIQKSIDNAINLGKSAIGIFTGNFENINQMQTAIEKGGLIDGISNLLDTTVDITRKTGAISRNVANTIKQGKNIILNNVQSNIEKEFSKQINSVEKLNKYINTWKINYENKDFNAMEKVYKNLEKELKNIVPMEKTIKEARTIENIHNLIKNNGQNFDLTTEELELAEKLEQKIQKNPT